MVGGLGFRRKVVVKHVCACRRPKVRELMEYQLFLQFLNGRHTCLPHDDSWHSCPQYE